VALVSIRSNLAADLFAAEPANLPPISRMLSGGGDTRIVCDSRSGENKYGCKPEPDPAILAYGSSTASTITPASLAAAERLRLRVMRAARVEPAAVTYARELERLRGELIGLCGLDASAGVEVIFAASGTDIHLIAAQLAREDETSAPVAVMIEAIETGSGVPAALGGRHFSDCTALGHTVASGAGIAGSGGVEIAAVAGRAADGAPRAAALIDAEVEALVAAAIGAGKRVLLNLVDVSKTGLIAPSLGCALDLRRRYADALDVLVDGCQFRLAPATLAAYLRQGFWVALTGSKFVGGPAFSGALLLPDAAARRLRGRELPAGLSAYSAAGEWPSSFAVSQPAVENYGLLLRWEAALAELRAFRVLPEAAIAGFVEAFASAARERLANDPAFTPLAVPALDRAALRGEKSWDGTPTIFPFILCAGGSPLSRMQTARVHALLAKDRCQLGQPVVCGRLNGMAVSALRLCLSARLIVDAVSPKGRGPAAVIAEAQLALTRAALLAGVHGEDSLTPAG
jgi:hypothetical protein